MPDAIFFQIIPLVWGEGGRKEKARRRKIWCAAAREWLSSSAGGREPGADLRLLPCATLIWDGLGGGDKGGLIQGCKACCKPQESEQRRDEQEKVGTGRSCRARNLRNCRRPRASKAMNSRFCRCGFLWAVSSVAGGFVVSLISRYRLWAPGVGFSIIDTVEREGTWRSRLGTSTAKAIGPSASCSRTLARRTDHAQLLGSIHLHSRWSVPRQHSNPGGSSKGRASAFKSISQPDLLPTWPANPQPGFPRRCITRCTMYEMRARELRTYAGGKEKERKRRKGGRNRKGIVSFVQCLGLGELTISPAARLRRTEGGQAGADLVGKIDCHCLRALAPKPRKGIRSCILVQMYFCPPLHNLCKPRTTRIPSSDAIYNAIGISETYRCTDYRLHSSRSPMT